MPSFRKLTAIFFFLVFSLSFLVKIPSSAFAIDIPESVIKQLLGNLTVKTPQDYAKEFCDKRSGELMNLETWFSGKCGEKVDTLSGEGVGFVDIIQLQIYEWWYGPQTKTFAETFVDYINGLEKINDSLSTEPKDLGMLKPSLSQPTGGVLGSLEQATKFFINNKPASSTEYIAYVSDNLKKNHIVTDTYAASSGYGFDALSPLLPLWRAFRNIAYLLFALAFVLYGIMIMFRVRIDSKTAATIQLAIPKLVTTLLLITFSYAIVGLLVDITTVFSALLIDVLRVGKIITDPSKLLIHHVSGQGWTGGAGSFVINWLTSLIVAPFIIFNLLLGGALGIVLGIGALAGYITPLGNVLVLALTLAIAISYFKLILKLFQSYISVIISLIFSPIILIGNIFPGSKSFSSWIMTIFGNLAVFPVTSFLLVLSYVLIIQPLLNLPAGIGTLISNMTGVLPMTQIGQQIWTPPMTTMNLVSNSYAGLTLSAIGIGLLLMASKYVDMILKALSVPPFEYGTAIGEALKGGSKLGETVLTYAEGRTKPRPRAAHDVNKTISSIP